MNYLSGPWFAKVMVLGCLASAAVGCQPHTTPRTSTHQRSCPTHSPTAPTDYVTTCQKDTDCTITDRDRTCCPSYCAKAPDYFVAVNRGWNEEHVQSYKQKCQQQNIQCPLGGGVCPRYEYCCELAAVCTGGICQMAYSEKDNCTRLTPDDA